MKGGRDGALRTSLAAARKHTHIREREREKERQRERKRERGREIDTMHDSWTYQREKGERILIVLKTSDRRLKATREGSK